MSPRPEDPSRRAANIFINYRRDDSAGHAGRLFDRLSNRFPGRVFMDIDTIEPGIDFVDSIEKAVGCCEVLIVLIGRGWLFLTDATGHRRLDDPNDFVRLEIAAALKRNIRIIPTLVEGATMPRPEDLPPELTSLARRNAIELSDVRWGFDMERLIQTIEGVLQEKAPSALMPIMKAPVPVETKARPRTWMVLAVLALLALPGLLGWSLARQLSPQETESTLAAGQAVPIKLLQASPEVAAIPARTTRTPMDGAAPQGEQRQPDSEAKKDRLGSLVRRGKSAFKNLRSSIRSGSKEGAVEQREGSERQGG